MRDHPDCGRCGHDRGLHGGDKHTGMCVGPGSSACGCRRFLKRPIASGPDVAPVFDIRIERLRRGRSTMQDHRWGGRVPW